MQWQVNMTSKWVCDKKYLLYYLEDNVPDETYILISTPTRSQDQLSLYFQTPEEYRASIDYP